MNLDYESDLRNAAFEKNHWWVRSRFGLLDRALARFSPAEALAVLEVGCGTGINLGYLAARYGGRIAKLIGADPQAAPQQTDRWKIQRDIPAGETFDLILLMDVLEHVGEPVPFLKDLRAHLKAGGRMLVTVPAFPFLWSAFDEIAHHRKRYTLKGLLSEFREAQWAADERFFLFAFLFPFFIAQRLTLRWRRAPDARVFKPVARWLNGLLYAVTRLEMCTWMPYNRYFGSSIVAFAQSEALGG